MSATVNIGTLEGLIRWKADDADLQRSLSDVAKKADVSKTQLKQYNQELAGIDSAYKRVVAAIDPTSAATQKYERAQTALGRALKAGLIDQHKHNELLEKAKETYSSSHSGLESLVSKIVQMTGVLGPAGAAGHEAAEGIEALVAKGAGVGELLASFGPLLPVIAAVAVALAGVALAFEGFEFIKEAVGEGLKLQSVIERLNDSLRNTGSYSGLSAHEIVELADKFEFLTGRSKQEEVEAATLLSRFKNLNEEGFRKGFDVVNAYAKAMGITAPEAARKLGPALDGNTRSVRSLREAGVDLTRGQIATLNQMVETGHIAEYQAKVFDILHEKVGTVADGFDKNLNRQMGRARDLFDEFKEGIASEVIPALEDTVSVLVESAGGWEYLKTVVSVAGHLIGDIVRHFVYGTVGLFYDLRIALNNVAIFFDKMVIGIAGSVERLAIAGEAIPGLGTIAKGLETVFHSAVNNASKDLYNDSLALVGNQSARAKLIAGLEGHRQALDGDTTANKKHGSAQDEVASAQKRVNDLIADANKITRSYSDTLGDLTTKLVDQAISQGKLLSAAEKGTLAYAQARQEAERLNAVESAIVQIEKAHRTEIEKLSDLKTKLLDEKRPNEAGKIQSQIDAENKAYARQVKQIGDLAGKSHDLKVATDERNKSNQQTDEFLSQMLTLQGELTDAIDGTSFSSREFAIRLDTQKRQLLAVAEADGVLGKSIAETTRREHERVNAIKDTIDVAKQLRSLDNQASLQTAISRIDASQSRYLQQIEEQYLQTVAAIGHGSIEEGKRIIDETEKVLALFGVDIGDLSAKIKSDLKTLQDAEISKAVAGASRTPFDLYKQERDRIEQYISNSTSRTSQQIKDAHAYLVRLDEQYWSDQLSVWSSSLDKLSGLFGGALGGMLQKIRSWINQIQQVMEAMQSLKLASGGFDSSTLGAAFTKYGTYAAYGFLAWVGLKIYEGWTQARTKFGEASIGGGTSGDSRIADQIAQVITDLTQQVADLASQWHLGLISLASGSVSIGANSDGEIIVKSLIDNVGRVFKTMTEALDYAKVQALKFATFSEQTSELVRAAILKSRATTTGGLQADIDFANRLATQNLSDMEQQFHTFLQTFVEDFRHLMTLFGPGSLRSLGDFAQLSTAAQSAIDSLLGGIQGMYDQLTGHKVDQDAIDERNRVAFNAQRAITIAQLTLLYEEIKARIVEYQVRLRILQSGVLGGGGGNDARPPNTKGGGVLLRDDRNPTGDSGLAALLQVLDNLARAMQGLPPEIAPGGVRRGGGGRNAANRTSVQSFIDDRRFQLSLVGMDDFHHHLAQIKKDYDAQILAAGKDKKLREQLLALQQQETAAAVAAHDKEVAAHQSDVRTQFTQLVAPNAFEQATRQFEDMKKEIEKSGFSADEAAAMLARLTAAEADAIKKLGQQQFASLLGDLSSIVADSDTNVQQHTLHNELLRSQEIINYQIKMIELRAEYELLKAKGVLTQQEVNLLDKAFGWIDANANILPGGKDWSPNFEQPRGEAIFARSYADAATNLNGAADKLRSAAQSLIDYQTSLHTDASLGLVDPRAALENAKADYEADRAKALGGDADSIGKLKDFAETYRRNLIAFSPSSELTASVLSGIDDTINRIKALPAVQQALSSDGKAIVDGLGTVASGVSMVHLATSAVNDNTKATKEKLDSLTPDTIADAAKAKQADYLNATLTAQQASAASLKAVSDDIKTLASNVLAWRTEARANVDESYEQLKDANVSLDKIASNTKHARKLAGTGG